VPRRRPRYSGTHPRRFEQRYKEHAFAAFPAHSAHLRAKGRTLAGTHLPVLLDEVVRALEPQPGGCFVDCTLGYGGHARALLERITAGGAQGRLIALDVDGIELPRAVARLASFGPALSAHRLRFAGIAKALEREGIAQVDGILADLGVSSMQLDDPSRGFSLKHDGPLDLRMDDRLARSGADLVATLPESELAEILRDLADEPDAAAIARAIVAARQRAPITTTRALADLVLAGKKQTRAGWREASAGAGRAVHPAARTFQALRIVVNDELGNLAALLRMAPLLLKPGARFAVISFQRGEEVRVADAFAEGLARGLYSEVRAPIRPTPEERRSNPRSSSARLRVAVRAARPPGA
jgi:16S rRNA (cytosine1402-N4)-methyltransferase